jgi:phosphate transport system permease protein
MLDEPTQGTASTGQAAGQWARPPAYAARRRRDRLARALFRLAGLVTIAVSAAIVFTLLRDALVFFSRVDKSSLIEAGWFPRRGMYDLRTLFVGSLLVTGVAMLVAAPLGVGGAIYLSEFASPRVRSILKPVLEVLAGIPSVVIGYFAISFITPDLVQRIWPEASFFNLLASGLGVGILTIPLVASVSEDAMRAVPRSLREGAYALGCRSVTVCTRVVIPASISGIVAALVLGISRAVGETMVVAIASGATGGSLFSFDLLRPGQTLTAAMAALGAGTDQVKGDSLAFQSLFFIGTLLFFLTLCLNLAGDVFVRRVRERY